MQIHNSIKRRLHALAHSALCPLKIYLTKSVCQKWGYSTYLCNWYVLEWLSRGGCAGRSIMHYVASHAEGLEELLEVNGIQWDIKDKKGESLLHYAVSSNCPMSAFLLAKKIPAACLWTNEAGKNPMQLAQEKSFGEVRRLYASPCLFQCHCNCIHTCSSLCMMDTSDK